MRIDDTYNIKAFEIEKAALLGDRQGALVVVSSLRGYRAAARRLIELYRVNGSVSNNEMEAFERAVNELEDL